MTDTPPNPPPVPAGAFRRLAALFYDLLLLVAVLFLGTALVLPLTGGEAITPQQSGGWEYAYRAWVAALVLGFFGISWTRRGQTLGMMSWKIRLERSDGRRLGWLDSARRLALGGAMVVALLAGAWLLGRDPRLAIRLLGAALLLPAALNYAWMAFDAQRRTLLDVLAGQRMARLGD